MRRILASQWALVFLLSLACVACLGGRRGGSGDDDDNDAAGDDDDSTASGDDDDSTASGDDDDAVGDDDDISGGDDDDTAGGGDDDDAGDDDDSLPEIPGPFSFSNPVLTDDDQSGVWDELETLFIQVDMTNNGPDFFNYPGAVLTCDNVYVSLEQAESWLFGLNSETSNIVAFTVDALAGLTVGTTITFEVSASALNCETNPDLSCPAPNTLVIEHVFGDSISSMTDGDDDDTG